MARKKLEKFGKAFPFINTKDSITGKLVKIDKGTTQFGEADFLILQYKETNVEEFASVTQPQEEISVCISSNLKGYNWSDLIGEEVTIEFVGNKRNPATKQIYKEYDVFVEE
jgi:hypothetical protein